MSQCMRFPAMWFVRPAKSQISLRIRAVWSEPLLVAWILYDSYATDWTSFGVSKLKMMLHGLIWVYTCQNTTLLEITCHGSHVILISRPVQEKFWNLIPIEYWLKNTPNHPAFLRGWNIWRWNVSGEKPPIKPCLKKEWILHHLV